jgi:hypothetical protein
MTPSAPRIEGRIRTAGVLIAAGLAIEAATLLWRHPLSFVAFTIAVPLLLLGGIAMFLLSLVKEGGPGS